MNFPNHNSPESVLESIDLLHPKVSAIMESAVAHAREYFDTHGKLFDVYLFSDLVRNEAREQLELLVLTDDDLLAAGFSRRDLPNNGLEVHIYDYRIKILKGKKGLLPSVGRTRAKREFFYQPSLWETKFINLVIIWNIDATYHLVELRLACPKYPETYPEFSAEHWSISIPPAPTTIVVEESFDVSVEDLDIGPIQLEETGTDTLTDEEDDDDNKNE